MNARFFPRSIFTRFLLFLAAYLLLFGLFSFQPMKNAVADIYSKGASGFLSLALPSGFVHVERNRDEKPGEENTIRILFGNKKVVKQQMAAAGISGKKDVDVKLQDFKIKFEEFFLFSLLFFLALLAITPLDGWRVKLKAAAAGIFLVFLFSWLKLLGYTLYQFSIFPTGVYQLTGGAATFVAAVYNNLKVGVGFLFATLVWVLVVFRWSDWRRILVNFG